MREENTTLQWYSCRQILRKQKKCQNNQFTGHELKGVEDAPRKPFRKTMEREFGWGGEQGRFKWSAVTSCEYGEPTKIGKSQKIKQKCLCKNVLCNKLCNTVQSGMGTGPSSHFSRGNNHISLTVLSKLRRYWLSPRQLCFEDLGGTGLDPVASTTDSSEACSVIQSGWTVGRSRCRHTV